MRVGDVCTTRVRGRWSPLPARPGDPLCPIHPAPGWMRGWGWTLVGGAPLLMVGAELRVRVGAWVFARGPGVVSADMCGPDKRNGGHQEAVIRGAAASPRGGACRVPRLPKVAAFLVSLLVYFFFETLLVHFRLFFRGRIF